MNSKIDSNVIELIRTRRPIVVVTHPRSGTHLTIDFLRKHFRGCGGWKLPLEANNLLYLSLDGVTLPNPQFGNDYVLKVLSRSKVPIIKTHSPGPDFTDVGFFGERGRYIPTSISEALRESARFLYVIRDIRTVMTSFQHWMSGFNQDARTLSFYDFLRQEPRENTNRIQQWVNHIAAWQAFGNVKTVRFEDLVSESAETGKQISEFLGIEARNGLLLPQKSSPIRSKFNRLFSFRPGSTAILGQNKGKPGKWDKLLTPEQSQIVLKDAAATMEQFGYTL